MAAAGNSVIRMMQRGDNRQGEDFNQGFAVIRGVLQGSNVATNIKNLIILRVHVVIPISLDCHLLMKVRISERRWTSEGLRQSSISDDGR